MTSDGFPQTILEVKQYFMNLGFKMIPLVPENKMPVKGFTYDMLQESDYDFPLDGDENIGMGHGPASGTYAVDVDFKEGKAHTVDDAVKVLFDDVEKTLASTLVIKTPKQGVHFIFTSDDGVYPEQKKYYSSQHPGVEIDIRSTNGLTVFPPSMHPETKYGKYSFISKTLIPIKMKWENVQLVLAERGFFTKDETTSQNDESLQSDYNIAKLLMGKFAIGTRRRSLNSLYCKLRIRGKTTDDAEDIVRKVNQKCAEPLDRSETNHNVKYAELFYQNHILPSLEKSKEEKKQQKKAPKFSAYDAASEMMNHYRFVSHISGEVYYYANGIYRKNGKLLIAKKCRQFWEYIDITTGMIVEITNIIYDKTLILTEDENEEIFDQDYSKIVLKNGVFDVTTGMFSDFDSSIMATIKHPVYYDKTKKCPRFLKFLVSCVNGDKKRFSQILEMMSLCFIKRYIIQKGYVLYGNGSNGKSTLLSILRMILGTNNTSSIPMQSFQKSQFIGYEIRGRSANISADGGTEPISKTGFLKAVLGGDAIRCEQKYQNPFDFVPFVTMIFTFNDLPPVHDDSDGFARKIQTIHFDQRFYGEARDCSVDEIAYDGDEKSGIFNLLMLVAARLLQTKKLRYESTVQQTKQVWLLRSDSFFKFKNEHIVTGSKYRVTREKMEEKYNDFCAENGMTPLSTTKLFSKLKEITGNGPQQTKIDGKNIRMWHGFTVSSELLKEVSQQVL